MKTLLEYTDYRTYLADWLADRKADGLPVSNRWFAMKMGVNSSSWLTSILSGKKNLSKESANKISALIKHDAGETRFFETLVFFNQSHSLEERNRYYAEINLLRKSRSVRHVSSSQYDYYTCWYHSAVRSLIGMYGFDGNYAQLAAMVMPGITAAQAKKSVELLESLGFIAKDDAGAYVLTSTAVTTGDEVRSLAVANFQQETMRLAQEALDRAPSHSRDIRATTLGISEKTFEEAKNILADARRRIIELANSDENADRVYQLNIQLFPLSKPITDPEKNR